MAVVMDPLIDVSISVLLGIRSLAASILQVWAGWQSWHHPRLPGRVLSAKTISTWLFLVCSVVREFPYFMPMVACC